MTVTADEGLVGRVLNGRYAIGKRIARGGMASVFMATDTRLDRVVAVKVMHSGLGDDGQFTDRFVREARAAAKLNHPNVVSVFDQGSDGDVTYLVMEYVPGQTLRDVMREEAPMPPGRALALIEQVLVAISAAHAAHLIHRDVKPENVLIAPDGTTKVTDFGLARAVSAATTATGGTLIGTVSYLAPEIVVNDGADARSDVYACGAVLYEMLTGFKPHAGETPIQVAYKHVHEDIARPSATVDGIPPYVDALVIRATARNRDQRSADAFVMLQQVRQVRRALDAGLDDDPDLTNDLMPSVDRQAVAVGAAAASSTRLSPASEPSPMVAFDDDEGTIVVAHATDGERTAVAPFDMFDNPRADGGGMRPPMNRQDYRRQRGDAPRKRRGLVLLIAALLLAMLAGLGGWYYGVGRYVEAPQFVGLSLEQAQQEAESTGFTIDVASERFDEEVPKGEVMASDPGAGDKVLPESQIGLTVSKGQERYDIPDLSGKSVDEATEILEDLNLEVGEQKATFSEDVDKDLVIRASDFDVGDRVKRDTAVDLNVSKGREPIGVVDFTGKTGGEATNGLEGAGFVVGATQDFSDDVAEGRVITQSPFEGELFRGDTVTIVVSRGPDEVDVPEVVGEEVDDAEETLEDAGFKVRRIGDKGKVFAQTPNDGKRKRGSTITIASV